MGSSDQPRQAQPSGKIKTVVVLVMENRSFDHMLGWMKSTINLSINGVTGQESNPLSTSDPDSKLIYFRNTSEYVDPDPAHSIEAIYEQLYGVPYAPTLPITPSTPPLMNGFAQEAESEKAGMSDTVMNGFRPDAIPVYRELVKSFAVCDRWFASVPSSTQPNRLYVHSATSHGLISNDAWKLIAGLPQKTIFDSLDEAGLSFGIYFQYPPSTLFYRSLRKLKFLGRFHDFDLSFKSDCKAGKLPNYVVVEQRYFDLKILPGNDDHPSHDVSEGQKLVKEVYEALRSGPQWDEILFIITYDEHGGFYDHVPPPAGVPSPDDIVGPDPTNFNFDRLGVRVPTFFISPWIEPGTVIHKPQGPDPSSEFEHSSIPATVKNIFGLPNFLTKRDAWAGTFDIVLTRSTPRTDCPVTLPVPTKLRHTAAKEDAPLTEFQEELVQMGAALNGDHGREGLYPDKLVEGMTVADAAKYVREAFETYKKVCKKCKESGMDECEPIVVMPEDVDQLPADDEKKKKPSFVHKLLACITCGGTQAQSANA